MVLTGSSLVQTELGSKAARDMGMEDAPHTLQQIVDAITNLVSFCQGADEKNERGDRLTE